MINIRNMGYGDIREQPKHNTNGFKQNPQNINRAGRQLSIKKQLKQLLDTDGTITFEKGQIVKVHADGRVTVKMPTKDMVAMKLIQWVATKKGNVSMKAIQLIIEHIDGKPKQSMDVQVTEEPKQTREERDARIRELIQQAKLQDERNR